MSTEVEAALVEIQTAVEVVEPELEGWKDYQHLNLSAESQAEVAKAIADFDRRHNALLAARDVLRNLMRDGHPELPVRTLPDAVFKDLQANLATIQAAFGRIESDEARKLNLSLGAPESK